MLQHERHRVSTGSSQYRSDSITSTALWRHVDTSHRCVARASRRASLLSPCCSYYDRKAYTIHWLEHAVVHTYGQQCRLTTSQQTQHLSPRTLHTLTHLSPRCCCYIPRLTYSHLFRPSIAKTQPGHRSPPRHVVRRYTSAILRTWRLVASRCNGRSGGGRLPSASAQ